jgi:hypothetical protein
MTTTMTETNTSHKKIIRQAGTTARRRVGTAAAFLRVKPKKPSTTRLNITRSNIVTLTGMQQNAVKLSVTPRSAAKLTSALLSIVPQSIALPSTMLTLITKKNAGLRSDALQKNAKPNDALL